MLRTAKIDRIPVHFDQILSRTVNGTLLVPNNKLKWTEKYDGYAPLRFDSPKLANQSNVDPLIGTDGFLPQFNSMDGKIDRRSFHGYDVEDGYPLNPGGRTGKRGKGELKRYGPNHIVDVIITRPKRDAKGKIMKDNSGRTIVEMIRAQILSHSWTWPCGRIDLGEIALEAAKRIFIQIVRGDKTSPIVDKLFLKVKAIRIYWGLLDDPRNTDNAWVETTSLNLHDERNLLKDLKFHPKKVKILDVQWHVIDDSMKVFEYHKIVLEKLQIKHNLK